MLCDNIRKHRKLNGMSQDELAEKLEVTRQSISLWETGQTQPSLENIIALSKLFNVSTDELLAEAKSEFTPVNSTGTHKGTSSKKIYIISAIICFILVVLVAVVLLLKGETKKLSDNNNTNTISTSDESKNNSSTKLESENNQTTNKETTSKETTSKETLEESKIHQNSNMSSNSAGSSSELANSDNDNKKDIYGYLKNFVIQNGTINGDYCYVSKPADTYGGYSSEDFSLYYWGDTEKIEFCLHSVLDNTFSINFYLYVPKNYTGNYEYISSYYYRDNGESLYQASGIIEAYNFTENYPLNCTEYIGSTEKQNEFMEMSREGICDLISCLEKFIEVENIEYSFKDFGFTKF